jgi:hypothetical protein
MERICEIRTETCDLARDIDSDWADRKCMDARRVCRQAQSGCARAQIF